MDEFIGFLRQFGELTERDVALIRREVEEVTFPKEAKLAEATKFIRELWFVRRGVQYLTKLDHGLS